MVTGNRSLPPGALAALLGLLILLMGRGLLRGYSYWHDELFSIGAASAPSWNALFRDWVLPDTHPPLHLTLLRAWVSLAGPDEIGSRLLSFLPACLALAAMARLTRGDGAVRQFVAIAFLGTSPLLAWQAQEVRPYAWGVLCTVLATGAMARMLRRNPSPTLQHCLRISLLVLSLTHYFGLIYGLVLVGIDLCRGGRCLGGRPASLVLLAAMAAWPLLHSRLGLGVERTAWIESTPLLAIASAAINGAFPAASAVLALIALLLLLELVRRRGAWPWPPPRLLWARLRTNPEAREARWLILQMLAFLVLVALLDLRKPLSVERYFFVLLAPLALLLGDLAQRIADRGGRDLIKATALVFSLLFTMHLIHSQEVLTARIRPSENYKDLAAYLAREKICERGCFSESGSRKRLRPYFDAIELRRLPRRGAPGEANTPLPFVGLHGEQKLIAPLLRRHLGSKCWQPVQSDASSTYVILPAGASPPAPASGMRSCEPARR